MGDARPFAGDFLIHHEFRTEVVFDESAVERVQRGGRQGLAVFRHGVGGFLEFREHRLPVDRAFEVLEVLVQERHARLRLVGVLEQIVDEQVLVDRGGHLGDEDGVVGVLRRLVMVRVPGVHRVAHLVDDRGHFVEGPGEVAEDVRVRMVGARREGAGALALVRVDVDPAVLEGAAHHIAIFFAERLDRLQDDLLRLFIGVFDVEVGDQRRVDIVVVELVEAEHRFAEIHVAVHGGEVVPDRFDEAVVDRGRHVLVGHAHGAGGLVMPGGRFRDMALDGPAVACRERVDVLPIPLVETAEGVLAQDAVAGHLQVDIARRGDFHFIAVLVGDAVEDHVGIHQVVGDLRGGGKDLSETGEELFLV